MGEEIHNYEGATTVILRPSFETIEALTKALLASYDGIHTLAGEIINYDE